MPARPQAFAYSGAHRIKGARGEVAISPAWTWPLAVLEEVHDGDTVLLRIDNAFHSRAVEWIRLRDVWAPEVGDPGGPEATADCETWFREHAPDGYVQVTTFRTSAPLEIRFRQSFTRYIGIITAFNGSELNSYLIDKGYVARGV